MNHDLVLDLRSSIEYEGGEEGDEEGGKRQVEREWKREWKGIDTYRPPSDLEALLPGGYDIELHTWRIENGEESAARGGVSERVGKRSKGQCNL